MAAAVTVLAGIAAVPANAMPGDAVQRAIMTKTGSTGQVLHGTRSIAGFQVSQARHAGKALTTYVQNRSDGVAVAAVLERGQSEAVFPGLLQPGQRYEPGRDGSLLILRGNDLLATVDPPWAVDAHGRELKAHYLIRGTAIVQSIDTTDATYPVIADPSIKAGFHIVPVFYVQYTWTETWWVKNHLPHVATGAALL